MDSSTWNSSLACLPAPHLLQTWQWAQVKAGYGWQPYPSLWHDRAGSVAAAAMVLGRSLPLRGFAARLQVMYVPKGPLLDWSDVPLRRRVLGDLRLLARRKGAIFIKIDPDVCLGGGIPGETGSTTDLLGEAVTADLRAGGWQPSTEQIQFRNTVLIDLNPAEDVLLARLKQKTRYNLRLALRKGVRVRLGSLADLPTLYRLYAETALRDGFAIRDQAYYRTVFETFAPAVSLPPFHPTTFLPASDRPDNLPAAPLPAIFPPSQPNSLPYCEPLIAEVAGELVAAVVIFYFGQRAWYLYGMSHANHRDKMPNHLLQWEAIRRAKAAGCTVYDLWGAPDEFSESDPLWGVYRFKEGLGGEVARHLGAWDLPVRPLVYRFYTQLLPRLLELMRRRGRRRTQALVNFPLD